MLQGDQINSSVWTVKDTWPLAFGCWITWFISSWEGHNCLKRWANSQNDNYFHSKLQPRIISNKNNCYFMNLLSLANNYFFLSLRWIAWSNSQKQDHLSLFESRILISILLKDLYYWITNFFLHQRRTQTAKYLYILIYSLSAKDVRYICESMNGIPLIICFFTTDQFVNFSPLFEANSLNCTSDSSPVLLTTFCIFTTEMIKKIWSNFDQNQKRF